MTYKINGWTYETKKELLEGAEYIENDINYLETRVSFYRNQNNDFAAQKVEENIESSKSLLNKFLALAA